MIFFCEQTLCNIILFIYIYIKNCHLVLGCIQNKTETESEISDHSFGKEAAPLNVLNLFPTLFSFTQSL